MASSDADLDKIAAGVRLILEGIGEDPSRPGLSGTPERVARMYTEIFGGIHADPGGCIVFLPDTGQHEEIVLVRDIPVYSVCEHHLLPFIGRAHVAYIPEEGRITGLSKIARVVDILSRRPQLQERLTTQVADTLMERLVPRGVMVMLEAEHLCMTMRGIKKPGSITVTSVVRGIFRTNPATRNETLNLLGARMRKD
ncbi:MAG TPA: GTP cyclohydrolase I FolE [Planctomycetes bacterium]|nr:GTP cyclohydrolase I FolE [Planctomycetota bacterium]